MLRGLLSSEDGGKVLLFVRMFYGQRSIFLWEDEVGDVHNIPQGEGGEQGDPLMPLQSRPTCCVGRHSGTVAPRWNSCSRSLTTSPSFVFRTELATFTLSCRKNFTAMLEFLFIWGRHKYGTVGGEEPEACAMVAGCSQERGPDSHCLERRPNFASGTAGC